MVTFVPRRRARRRGERRPSGDRHVYAALDLGTNNCRLLVARPQGRDFRVIDSYSRIVRLGEGLQANGTLSDDAIGRTIAALQVCVGKMQRRGVTRARSIATEACRQAANCDEFLGRVTDETGLEIEIISTREEAQLAVMGCAPLLRPDAAHAIVFDIGGGSTEVMWLGIDDRGQPELLDCMSLPFGVVNMAEIYGGHEVTLGGYAEMITDVRRQLAPFEAANGIATEIEAGRVQMLGTSGTVTTLAGIHLRLTKYQRSVVDGTTLTFDQVKDVSLQLRDMNYRQRLAHPCIGNDRADLVVPGCAVLAAICELWPVGSVRVADRGLREGILFTLMGTDRGVHRPIGRDVA